MTMQSTGAIDHWLNIELTSTEPRVTEPKPPAEPTVYMFGHREREPMQEQGAVGRWLLGEHVELSADDLQKLRIEFTQGERYRQLLLDGIMRVSRKLSEQGSESVNAIETPAATHREVYWSGFAAGQAEAYGTASAAISELHVIAALGIEG